MTFSKGKPNSMNVRFITFLVLTLLLPASLIGQVVGGLGGQVLDPTGALVPGATITLTQGTNVLTATSTAEGRYEFRSVPAGTNVLTADAQGFAQFSRENVVINSTQVRQMDISLAIAEQQQQVDVSTDAKGLSLNSDENPNAIVLKGSDLDALSDDPDQLLAEVKALAGPSAGPDGGQVYIDGFSGGQLPPKSSILEIRVNQNPFSAEYDRIGYGRINIITKPGASKVSGAIKFGYLNSALDTANPFATVQPAYQYYSLAGSLTGPITKNSSYLMVFQYWERQKQNFISAVNPANTAGTLNEAFPSPFSTAAASPRIDFQMGKHVISIIDLVYRIRSTGVGVGAQNLPEQASNSADLENIARITDSVVINSHLVNEIALQWRRVRLDQTPDFTLPSVTVSGSFTTGGSAAGKFSDHQDLFEFRNYASLTTGFHFMRFGVLMRSYRDATYSNAGSNGSYTFQTLNQYQAGTPSIYTATAVNNPRSRILTFDAALFFQDEWRLKPNLNLGYGLRVEGQSRIHDRVNWAPRISLTWAPGNDGKTPPKTSINVAGGLFYNRFGLATEVQTVRNNGINLQTYVVQNPTFYNPNAPILPSLLSQSAASIPTVNTLDPHFHASENIQASFGVTRMLGNAVTLNVNYLYTRGVHQYLTNNLSAPAFNPTAYTVTGPTPTIYNYQFQSGGIFKQQQIIVTVTTRYKKLSLRSTYTYGKANSDTQGVGSVPSAGQNPELDYGRATFGLTNQLQLTGSYTAPLGIIVAPFVVAQSGTPYDITLGNDLTENNQFNARPTYGNCGVAGVVSTPFGCLDTNPLGKGETIIPHNLGTGPANAVVNLTILKTVGIGSRVKRSAVSAGATSGTPTNTAPPPPRYMLSITGGVTNIFNMVMDTDERATLLIERKSCAVV